MNIKTLEIIERLAVVNLEKSLTRLSRVSAGTWEILDINVSFDTLGEGIKKHRFKDDIAWLVYFNVEGEYPFNSFVIFESPDFDCISKFFLGYSFLDVHSLQFKELLLSELGNILLNPMVTFVSNTLKKSFMPTAPKCVQEKHQNFLKIFENAIDLRESFLIIKVTLVVYSGKSLAKIILFNIIPKKLQTELEQALKDSSEI
ncbi:MAG: hypothetical protein L6420_04715 [Elusimicrobia bacterium]|nr:hypothetical protein [Elusimicrobiota bacterium]